MQQLEATIGGVCVANDRVARRVEHKRRMPARIRRRDALTGTGAVGIVAVQNLKITVRAVGVGDDRVSAAIQRKRVPPADQPRRIWRRDALAAPVAVWVVAVQHAQVVIASIGVAHDRVAGSVQDKRNVIDFAGIRYRNALA